MSTPAPQPGYASRTEVGDARQAGRFMLLWHEDSPQSDEARDELIERARELAG